MKSIPISVAQDADGSSGTIERRVLSRKELAKEQRQAAYQSAKARRATDPRFIAMKEAAKLQRRAVYQKAKDRRKAVDADAKDKRKLERQAERTAQHVSRRAVADGALMKLITWVTQGSVPEND